MKLIDCVTFWLTALSSILLFRSANLSENRKKAFEKTEEEEAVTFMITNFENLEKDLINKCFVHIYQQLLTSIRGQ